MEMGGGEPRAGYSVHWNRKALEQKNSHYLCVRTLQYTNSNFSPSVALLYISGVMTLQGHKNNVSESRPSCHWCAWILLVCMWLSCY